LTLEVAVSRLVALIFSFAVLAGIVGEYHPPARYHATQPLDYRVNPVAVIGDSYTAGTGEGGLGSSGWTARTWVMLAQQGIPLTADVVSESGSGYAARGDAGGIFEDLTARAVKPDDLLVVFFGSRNDQVADPVLLPVMVYSTFQLARRLAPNARFLVIGPPWPTADPPVGVLRIRDILSYQARLAGAQFVDPIAAGWFVGRPELIGDDGVHPTDAGHAYLADMIAPLIGAQLF
jgi:GDSL-like lipase/acylhydrolase family protein